MKTLPIICVLCMFCAAAVAPATRPAKPPTFAELKAENEKLRAEVQELKTKIAKLEKAQVVKGEMVKVGMTLKELEPSIADMGFGDGRRYVLDSDNGKTQSYHFFLNEDTGRKDNVLTGWRYSVQVENGKIVSFSKDVQ